MVTTEAVRTTRARVPEFLTPPVAPAHASPDDVQAEAFDLAAHALIDALAGTEIDVDKVINTAAKKGLKEGGSHDIRERLHKAVTR